MRQILSRTPHIFIRRQVHSPPGAVLGMGWWEYQAPHGHADVPRGVAYPYAGDHRSNCPLGCRNSHVSSQTYTPGQYRTWAVSLANRREHWAVTWVASP